MKLCVYGVNFLISWKKYNMDRNTIQDLDISCRKKIEYLSSEITAASFLSYLW